MALPAAIGPYRIVRLLGEGGMGAVYEARQEPLDRRVALKVLRPEYASRKEAVARFFTEAKVLGRLAHPSIVQISDFGQSADGQSFLVMEYLRGETLAQRLLALHRRGERLATQAVLQLGWQVADVLAVAHAQGVAHRDLKPENLMLIADPIAPSGERVKILDFGIAKLTLEDGGSALKTDTQAVIGTPTYMSPEQCAGAGGVTVKTDVYALGCVLYEALAGRPPFIADGGGQLIGMHLFKEPPPLVELAPRLPPAVAALVHRLLTKDKAKRPDMSAAADELGRLLGKLYGAGPVARSPLVQRTDPDAPPSAAAQSAATTLGAATGQRRARRRGRLGAVLGAAGVVAAGATLIFRGVLVSRAPPPAPPAVAATAGAVASTPAPTTPPAPLRVLWRVDSEPQGATILDDSGQRLGETPWTTTPAAGASWVTLRLQRSGFLDATVSLDPSRSESPRIKLTALPEPPRPVPARATPAASRRPPAVTKRKGIGFED